MREPEFRPDLYRGAARDYDRFRIPYPRDLINDLSERCLMTGSGRLLDLACGTGQVCFALHDRFAEVWAVDQEPDMIDVARAKAEAGGIGNVRFLTSAAADLSAPDESFDLVAIGNAFHRLPREAVAARVLGWLRPCGFLALLWGGMAWTHDGGLPWQRALSATVARWRTRAGADDRLPPGYDEARSRRPDLAILRETGFEVTGTWEFHVPHVWTADALTGFVFSTSILSRTALGDLAPAFEADLHRELTACDPAARFEHDIRFAYDLARRPRRFGDHKRQVRSGYTAAHADPG